MRDNRKRNFNMKNEKGAISLFVVLSMMFFLVFMIGAYTMIARRNQQQAETMSDLQSAYKKDGSAQYDSIMGTADIYIPIGTVENYYKMISGENIEVNGVTYQAKPDAKYMLTNNIEISMSSLVGFRGDDTQEYKFKDYLLYNSGYEVQLNGYDVYYTFDSDNDGEDEKYKLLVFDGVGQNNLISDNKTSGTKTNFSMYKDALYYSDSPHKFLLYIERNNRNEFEELILNTTYFITEINNTTLPDMGNLTCIQNQVDTNDKYFLFIQYDKTNSAGGGNIAEVLGVGDYVKYKLNYRNMQTTTEIDAAGKLTREEEYGWRVLSIDDGQVKLVSVGSPLAYTYNGTVANVINDLITNFENTTFSYQYGSYTRQVTGKYFKNAYAKSVTTMDYAALSKFITGSINKDYISEVGGINNTSLIDGYPTYTTGWFPNKAGVLDNETNYWVPKNSGVNATNAIYYVRRDGTSAVLRQANSGTYYIRPVVTLCENLIIDMDENGKSGDGSKENPYDIKFKDEVNTSPSVGDYVLYANSKDDYNDVFNYRSISIDGKTSPLNGWRILNIAEDGTIKIISAGVPLRYNISGKNVNDIINDLGVNFANTDFERIKPSANVITQTEIVKGSNFLNSLYAEKLEGFDYEEFSAIVYGHDDYITASIDQDYGLNKNTIDESNNDFIINDWNSEKADLINLDSGYVLGSKTYKDESIFVHPNDYLVNAINGTQIGVRIVVTLKPTTKILTGTGTKADPYKLSSDASADVGEFKIGDYVKYDTILAYNNVNKNVMTANKNEVTLTGWRVLSYENGTLKLISAGIPFYTEAHASWNVTSQSYADYIKTFNYKRINIRNWGGTQLSNQYNPFDFDPRVEEVECIDYDQYSTLYDLYQNNEVDKDLIFLPTNYWLGSAVRIGSNYWGQYQLRYVTPTDVAATAERQTFGLRPIITIETGYTIDVNQGTSDDPHILTW